MSLDLNELKRLEAERTQGPYKIVEGTEVYSVLHGFFAGTKAYGGNKDADFIAFCANNAKQMIAELEVCAALRSRFGAEAMANNAKGIIEALECLQKFTVRWPEKHITIFEMLDETRQMKEENERLREALKWYADENTWGNCDTIKTAYGWEKAREALNSTGMKNGGLGDEADN